MGAVRRCRLRRLRGETSGMSKYSNLPLRRVLDTRTTCCVFVSVKLFLDSGNLGHVIRFSTLGFIDGGYFKLDFMIPMLIFAKVLKISLDVTKMCES